MLLFVSAVSVAFFHALAPDHWLPFSALARSSKWSMKKLALITFLGGLGHVLSSLILGFIGLWLGLAVGGIEGMESMRGAIGVWLLIGFGVAYGLWGLKHAQHHHPHVTLEEAAKQYAARRMWMLFAILVFGPCEPLIPLMFVALQDGMASVILISAAFSVVTIGMIMAQSCMAYAGMRLMKAQWMERYAHAMAGAVIALTAIFVLVTGV